MFVILLFIFLLILIIVNIIFISNVSKTNKRLVYGDGSKLVFGGTKKLVFGGNKTNAKHNAKQDSKHNHPSGWQLYTLENCVHCDKQIDNLKGFNTYIKYKEDGNKILVNNIEGKLYPKHIEGFPFWYNSTTGEERYGPQEVDTLLAI